MERALDLAALFQLYAPLAGLLVLAFWVGKLSERVSNIRKDLDDLSDRHEAAVGAYSAEGGMLERIIRLESKADTANDKLGSLDRGMQGVQRQLANLATTALDQRNG